MTSSRARGGRRDARDDGKPELGTTAPDTTVSIDFHVHSEGSYDCRTPIVDVLERAAAAGLDGVCITDHDTIEQSLAAATIAPEYGLFAIPSVEVSTQDGHVLAIGVETCPEPGHSFDRTVAAIRNRGGLAIVPHPFQRSRHGVPASAIDDCDGIETHNAMCLTGVRNRQASQFATRHEFAAVAGSDAHTARLVGRSVTDVHLEGERSSPTDEPIDQDAVIEAIAAGRTTTRGTRASTASYLQKYARNVSIKLRSSLESSVSQFSP